ncbi:MAG: septum formation initiator family protein [Acutalibacteraceae bacterium]
MKKRTSNSVSSKFFAAASNNFVTKKVAAHMKRAKKRRMKYAQNTHPLSFTTKAVFGIIVFALSVAAIVSLVKSQISISEKQKILNDLNLQIQQQQTANDNLEKKINGSLDDYIEEYARDKLDMVKPGERVYINTAGN